MKTDGSRKSSDRRPAAALTGLEVAAGGKKEFAAVYRLHGACIVRNLISQDIVKSLDAEARRLSSAVETGQIPASHVTWRPSVSGGQVFERIDPVCEFSPVMLELAGSANILRLADAAVGGRAALFKDKLIYKIPGDAGYDLHQDYPYIYEVSMPADAVTTLLIAIDPMCARNGCLSVYSGYHRNVLQAPPGKPRDVAPEAVDAAHRRELVVEPGDGVFFHALAPHDSGPNLTAATRRALFFTYTAQEHAGGREAYYRHRRGLGQEGLFR